MGKEFQVLILLFYPGSPVCKSMGWGGDRVGWEGRQVRGAQHSREDKYLVERISKDHLEKTKQKHPK